MIYRRENETRRGLRVVRSKRHARAKSHNVIDYDATHAGNYVIYADANVEYAWALLLLRLYKDLRLSAQVENDFLHTLL